MTDVPEWEKPFLMTEDELRDALADALRERDQARAELVTAWRELQTSRNTVDRLVAEQMAGQVACWHVEPGTPCDWNVCRQPDREDGRA